MVERFFHGRKIAQCTLLLVLSCTHLGFSQIASATPKEALTLRRITEYWKDGDYVTVKKQIIDFLEKHPHSPLCDHLNAMLGDLYFQEKNFDVAIQTYALIENAEIKEKTTFNYLQACFEKKNFLSVIEQAQDFLKIKKGKEPALELKVRYLLAESCFRQALKCTEMEKKIFYLKMAKPHYSILTQTKYSEKAFFPLAEIHRLLREDQRAAALYLKLAEKHPEHQERFLFQAAILQIKEDKQEAIKNFKKVHTLGGKRCRLAAFNTLILLYQADQYEEFLTFYRTVAHLMPDQKADILQFYEGRCHYYLGDYLQAVFPLKTFIQSPKNRSTELKTAFLLLINCSRHLKDLSLLEHTFSLFKTTFPKDSDLPKILLIHAQMCRENGDFATSLTDLKNLFEQYPQYEDAAAVYDYALLLSQTERWKEAREAFLVFLNKHSDNERKNAAWRHLINCSIEEIKHETTPSAKEAFITILQNALHQDVVLSQEEKQTYTLIMIRCEYEVGQYEKAIEQLCSYIQKTKEPATLSEAHLLLALCYQKKETDPSLFIEHAEKALSLYPLLSDKKTLHVELYNAYLSKALLYPTHNQALLAAAATHLFASSAWQENTLKLDNCLWLANYYYQKVKEGSTAEGEKAYLLFSHLLKMDFANQLMNIAPETAYLESETLKFAHLLELIGKKKEKITLLEAFLNKQNAHQAIAWKLQKKATLELARAYENDKQFQKAIETYKTLTASAKKICSITTSQAKLQLAKLQYRFLKPEENHAQSPAILAILHILKDMQIQKVWPAEPLHLEAALLYAEIRSSLSPREETMKNSYFFYKRMREDFHSLEDPITIAYTEQRKASPEKSVVFEAYMNYLDAQMLKCQAALAKKENKLDSAKAFEEQALHIFDTLLKNESTLYPYLLDRVQKARIEVVTSL